MKIFAFLMAVLVLVLSVMPCADTNAMGKSEVKTTTVKAAHQQGQADDDCSPFCQCSCCAGFSINHIVASFSTLSLADPLPVAAFLPSEIIEIALPIWQPPQLLS